MLVTNCVKMKTINTREIFINFVLINGALILLFNLMITNVSAQETAGEFSDETIESERAERIERNVPEGTFLEGEIFEGVFEEGEVFEGLPIEGEPDLNIYFSRNTEDLSNVYKKTINNIETKEDLETNAYLLTKKYSNINNIRIEASFIEINYKNKVKLFGFIPINLNNNIKIFIAEYSKVRKSWLSLLTTSSLKTKDIESNINNKLTEYKENRLFGFQQYYDLLEYSIEYINGN